METKGGGAPGNEREGGGDQEVIGTFGEVTHNI